MKTLSLIAVFVGGSFSLCIAQNAPTFTPAPGATILDQANIVNVPDSVVRKFISDFPNADHAQWFPDGKNIDAVFDEKDDSVRAVYAVSGALLQTTRKLDTTALPGDAKLYLAQKYPNQKVKAVWRVTKQDNTNYYDVKISKSKLRFDIYGKLISQTPVTTATQAKKKTTPGAQKGK